MPDLEHQHQQQQHQHHLDGVEHHHNHIHLPHKVERVVDKVKSGFRRVSGKFRHPRHSSSGSISSLGDIHHARFPSEASTSSDGGSSGSGGDEDGVGVGEGKGGVEDKRRRTASTASVKGNLKVAADKQHVAVLVGTPEKEKSVSKLEAEARKPKNSPARRIRQRLSSLSFASSASSSLASSSASSASSIIIPISTSSPLPATAFPRHPHAALDIPFFGRGGKKRTRTASDSAIPRSALRMTMTPPSVSSPLPPPPVAEEDDQHQEQEQQEQQEQEQEQQGEDVDPFVVPRDSDNDGARSDPPSQFLIEDPDSPEPSTPLPAPAPAPVTPDVLPAHELPLATPPETVSPAPAPSAPLLLPPDAAPAADISKLVVPPSPAPSTESESDTAPALYLPQLVLPTMFLPIPNTDPLSTLLTKYVPNAERRPPRDTTGDYARADFHTLVMTNSWRALARMARDRLVQTDPEDVERIFNLWYLRLSSLARLRLFNQAATELHSLLDALAGVDRTALGRVFPFELDVLAARAHVWAAHANAASNTGAHPNANVNANASTNGNASASANAEGADALARLLRTCRARARAARNADERAMWVERGARVGLIAASHFVENKDFAAATALLEPLLAQGQGQGQEGAAPELRAAVGRVYLQAGDLRAAEAHFAVVAADAGAPESLKMLDAALLACAHGEWARAEDALRAVVADDPGAYAAVNDLAVALLSQGKIKEATGVLEAALREAPAALAMAEPFLFNLSSLYELRSTATADKKRDLLIEVAKWSGDGLRTTCLKLPVN